jgi:hypothetical protein
MQSLSLFGLFFSDYWAKIKPMLFLASKVIVSPFGKGLKFPYIGIWRSQVVSAPACLMAGSGLES